MVVLEDRDEYTARSVFWVPASARWDIIQKEAKKPVNRALNAHSEIIAFDKIVADATRRNKIFFEKLGI